jgi:hypothetical protein
MSQMYRWHFEYLLSYSRIIPPVTPIFDAKIRLFEHGCVILLGSLIHRTAPPVAPKFVTFRFCKLQNCTPTLTPSAPPLAFFDVLYHSEGTPAISHKLGHKKSRMSGSNLYTSEYLRTVKP